MRSKFLSVVVFTLFFSVSESQKIFYNVKDLGAKGDGTASDTRAINKAIEDAALAGGGTIYFPAGNYLSGSIHLKNNICLFDHRFGSRCMKQVIISKRKTISTTGYDDLKFLCLRFWFIYLFVKYK